MNGDEDYYATGPGDQVSHGRHRHSGPFAVVQRGRNLRGLAAGWVWEVRAPAIAGIGGVPWWVTTVNTAGSWAEAFAAAEAAVTERRRETAEAVAAYRAGGRISGEHGERWRPWRRRRPPGGHGRPCA